MSPIDIELAGGEHLATIPAIELAASSMFPENDLPLHLRYRVTEAALLHEAQSASRLWVALTDDRMPVGFAMVAIVDGLAHLDELDVVPKFARRGIGTQLLNTIIDWASDEGFPALTLVTFRHLPWNAPFYKRFGFVAMEPSEHGAELASLLKQESNAGIDLQKRVCMKLNLSTPVS